MTSVVKLIKFEAPLCAACINMDPAVQELENKYPHLRVQALCVTESPSLAARYRVRGAPTFIALNSKNEVLGIRVGMVQKPAFIKWIDDL